MGATTATACRCTPFDICATHRRTDAPTRPYVVHAGTGILHAATCIYADDLTHRSALHRADAAAMAAASVVSVCTACSSDLLPVREPLSADDQALADAVVAQWVAAGATPDGHGIGTFWFESLAALAVEAVRAMRDRQDAITDDGGSCPHRAYATTCPECGTDAEGPR